ncbi:DUF2934 domain-containing protein [Nitrosococcus oceani]|uniref:DUF2934 domain-containing protein n=2 Tax=Nitrosococcus oceani TaxID=1229 RepID=Q3JCR2_NITOC|nr:DUF2934 domain-containing protein [Nitrosococcus oceani]KFI20207.1 hypothetical protein IB75_04390 [Nitrosococcus oceani C-27]ABA57384.1 hypothetical protein Noc_0871 [Nitrosococcus oceani ATCC 19707]EDZ67988.1 hypothetical protein NOC27_1315 [Nitrosococcus oceani AFC27]KFI23460.1 hypothetical protein HW44_04280 [Nitrosococcus oceani]GEM21743.1 hypothetical protein NONS58_31960 [Nitrosococcus oceani]
MSQTFKDIIGTVAAKLSKTAAKQLNRILAKVEEIGLENSASDTHPSSAPTGGTNTPEAPQKAAADPDKTSLEKPGPGPVSPEERWKMIAEAAYYIAEERGPQNSSPEENWRQAEAQIDTMLAATQKQVDGQL